MRAERILLVPRSRGVDDGASEVFNDSAALLHLQDKRHGLTRRRFHLVDPEPRDGRHTRTDAHVLTAAARLAAGRVSYPGQQRLFDLDG